jgi:hypothetical protein
MTIADTALIFSPLLFLALVMLAAFAIVAVLDNR